MNRKPGGVGGNKIPGGLDLFRTASMFLGGTLLSISVGVAEYSKRVEHRRRRLASVRRTTHVTGAKIRRTPRLEWRETGIPLVTCLALSDHVRCTTMW